MAVLVSELVVTVIFAVVVAPILLRGTNASEVHLWVIWVTVTSPLYWLLVVATVTVVVWLFRR